MCLWKTKFKSYDHTILRFSFPRCAGVHPPSFNRSVFCSVVGLYMTEFSTFSSTKVMYLHLSGKYLPLSTPSRIFVTFFCSRFFCLNEPLSTFFPDEFSAFRFGTLPFRDLADSGALIGQLARRFSESFLFSLFRLYPLFFFSMLLSNLFLWSFFSLW